MRVHGSREGHGFRLHCVREGCRVGESTRMPTLNDLTVPRTFSTEQRDKLCWRNAARLYAIDVDAGVRVSIDNT